MDNNLKKKTIESWAKRYKSYGYWVQVNLPGQILKSPAIHGIVPDILARRDGCSIIICVEDQSEYNSQKYIPLREWMSAGRRELIIAWPGEWPNTSGMSIY